MDIAWTDFGAALALVLVLEGVVPFIAPAALRRTYDSISRLPDGQLRVVGAGSMVIGVLILYLVR